MAPDFYFLFQGDEAMRSIQSVQVRSFPGAAINIGLEPAELMIGYFLIESEIAGMYTTVIKRIPAPVDVVTSFRAVLLLSPLSDICPEAIEVAWIASQRSVPQDSAEKVDILIETVGRSWYQRLMTESLPDLSEIMRSLHRIGIPTNQAAIQEERVRGTLGKTVEGVSGLSASSFDVFCPLNDISDPDRKYFVC